MVLATGWQAQVGTGAARTVFFQDDFSSGNMSNWDFVWSDVVNFNWHADNDRTFSGSGYSAKCHYRTSGISSPHGTPTLGQTAGGALAGNQYFVTLVYVQPNTPTGWINMIATNEANFTTSDNNLLTVTSPPSGETFYYYNVYAGTATGTANQKLQNANPLAIGQDWTQSVSGLGNLGSYPGSLTADSTSQTRQFVKWPRPNAGIGLHTFTRFRLYMKSPETGGQKIQIRKLHRSTSSQANGGATTWEALLVARDTDGTGSVLIYGNQGDTLTQQNAFTTTNKLAYDTWYTIELEQILNNPVSSSNGEARVWVTPSGGSTTLWGENTAFRVRGVTDVPIGSLLFGDQVNRNTGTTDDADEIRYFGDIVVADTYTGP